MSRLRIALAGRDTCNGSCESHAGCDCVRAPQPLTDYATLRAAQIEQERTHYARGWRWGVLDGLVLGALLMALAIAAGQHFGA